MSKHQLLPGPYRIVEGHDGLKLFDAEGDEVVNVYVERSADPYHELAASLFNIPSNTVTREQRNEAKRRTYMFLYGANPDATT